MNQKTLKYKNIKTLKIIIIIIGMSEKSPKRNLNLEDDIDIVTPLKIQRLSIIPPTPTKKR